MGARIMVVALDRLEREGRLTRNPIDLHLIAPILRGIRAANSSTWMMPLFLPFGLSTLVKNAEPARDLAQSSRFQRELEAARFAANVRVAITLAEHDRLARRDSTCVKLAKRWHASVLVLPGTTHQSVLSALSDRERAQLAASGPAPGRQRVATTDRGADSACRSPGCAPLSARAAGDRRRAHTASWTDSPFSVPARIVATTSDPAR